MLNPGAAQHHQQTGDAAHDLPYIFPYGEYWTSSRLDERQCRDFTYALHGLHWWMLSRCRDAEGCLRSSRSVANRQTCHIVNQTTRPQSRIMYLPVHQPHFPFTISTKRLDRRTAITVVVVAADRIFRVALLQLILLLDLGLRFRSAYCTFASKAAWI